MIKTNSANIDEPEATDTSKSYKPGAICIAPAAAGGFTTANKDIGDISRAANTPIFMLIIIILCNTGITF